MCTHMYNRQRGELEVRLWRFGKLRAAMVSSLWSWQKTKARSLKVRFPQGPSLARPGDSPKVFLTRFRALDKRFSGCLQVFRSQVLLSRWLSQGHTQSQRFKLSKLDSQGFALPKLNSQGFAFQVVQLLYVSHTVSCSHTRAFC